MWFLVKKNALSLVILNKKAVLLKKLEKNIDM